MLLAATSFSIVNAQIGGTYYNKLLTLSSCNTDYACFEQRAELFYSLRWVGNTETNGKLYSEWIGPAGEKWIYYHKNATFPTAVALYLNKTEYFNILKTIEDEGFVAKPTEHSANGKNTTYMKADEEYFFLLLENASQDYWGHTTKTYTVCVVWL